MTENFSDNPGLKSFDFCNVLEMFLIATSKEILDNYYTNILNELPYKLPNDLRLNILKN